MDFVALLCNPCNHDVPASSLYLTVLLLSFFFPHKKRKAVLDSYERCRDVAHALNLYINITDDDGVSCVEDDTHYLQVKAG